MTQLCARITRSASSTSRCGSLAGALAVLDADIAYARAASVPEKASWSTPLAAEPADLKPADAAVHRSWRGLSTGLEFLSLGFDIFDLAYGQYLLDDQALQSDASHASYHQAQAALQFANVGAGLSLAAGLEVASAAEFSLSMPVILLPLGALVTGNMVVDHLLEQRLAHMQAVEKNNCIGMHCKNIGKTEKCRID